MGDPDNRRAITYHLGLLANAISDALLEALKVLSNVSLLLQQHLDICVSELGTVSVSPARSTASPRGEVKQESADDLVVATLEVVLAARASQANFPIR